MLRSKLAFTIARIFKNAAMPEADLQGSNDS
jgi:hypothetical protein